MTFACDHLAFRVTDIERSTRFYVDAFDARIVTNPFVIEGKFAAAMMDGAQGVCFKLRHLRFARGMVELFEFIDATHPPVAVTPMNAPILHAGFQVDDVDRVASLVEHAGGRLLLPVTRWGKYKLTFCADPDGNIIELADAPIEDLVTETLQSFPEARPGGYPSR
jgi:glyoxylase I family protein